MPNDDEYGLGVVILRVATVAATARVVLLYAR